MLNLPVAGAVSVDASAFTAGSWAPLCVTFAVVCLFLAHMFLNRPKSAPAPAVVAPVRAPAPVPVVAPVRAPAPVPVVVPACPTGVCDSTSVMSECCDVCTECCECEDAPVPVPAPVVHAVRAPAPVATPRGDISVGDDSGDSECSICVRPVSKFKMRTHCNGESMCVRCVKMVPICPYCRAVDFKNDLKPYASKNLKLTVASGPFDAILGGAKTEEYRKNSPFYNSRLDNKQPKFIELYNGGQLSRRHRWLRAKVLSVDRLQLAVDAGTHQFNVGDYKISLGEIVYASV